MVKKIKIIGSECAFREDLLIQILEKKYDVIESDDPDYIISYSEYPDFLQFNGIRIQVIGENIRPDFNLVDYAIGFDHIVFEDRYYRWPLYARYKDDFQKALKKHYGNVVNKRKFCNFIVSNDRADVYRERFYRKLNSYKHIDSGGKYLNNINGPVLDKRKFQENYKFSLAFENSSTKGYVTEKIIQAWAAGTIPIYWGDPLVAKEFNPKAFINCLEFNSDEEIINHIQSIDEDDILFKRILLEPILCKTCYANEYVSDEGVSDFLYNIFEQPIMSAFRRNDKISAGYGFWKLHERSAIEYREMQQSKLVKGAYRITKLLKKTFK